MWSQYIVPLAHDGRSYPPEPPAERVGQNPCRRIQCILVGASANGLWSYGMLSQQRRSQVSRYTWVFFLVAFL